jgi:DNA-directed RNA polymerase specialized sigma24 family protein
MSNVTSAPWAARAEILPHLLAGESLKQIAAETRAKLASVHSAASRACKMHGVTMREEFASLPHRSDWTAHGTCVPRAPG